MEEFQIGFVMDDRHVESDENTKLSYIDGNNLYEWAMSQPLPTGEFEKIPLNPNTGGTGGALRASHRGSFACNYNLDQLVEELLQIPDDNEFGFFIECDLEYPVEIKEKTKNVPLCPYQTEAES